MRAQNEEEFRFCLQKKLLCQQQPAQVWRCYCSSPINTGSLILVLCVSTPVSKAASEAQIKQFTRTDTALAAGGVVTPQRLPQPRQGFWDGQEML